MEKTFSKIEISVIKSTAKNVAPFVAKKAKVDVQIEETKAKVQKLLEGYDSTLLKSGITMEKLIRRPELDYEKLAPLDP